MSNKIEQVAKIEKYRGSEELFIWLIFSFLPLLQPALLWLQTAKQGYYNYVGFFVDSINSLVISFLLVLFPLIFRQVFGSYPLQALRGVNSRYRANTVLEMEASKLPKPSLPEKRVDVNSTSLSTQLDNVEIKSAMLRVKDCDSHMFLSIVAQESAKIAKNVQRRAGVFLMSGVTIAGLGLLFFYYYNHIIETELHYAAAAGQPTAANYMDILARRIPAVAILFFIEFIALFFLRLFKSTMDDYRYFEAITRGRENALLALKLSFERNDPSSCKDVIEMTGLLHAVGRLGKEETTETLETKKLQKDEIVLLEKMVDVLGTSRKESSKKE